MIGLSINKWAQQTFDHLKHSFSSIHKPSNSGCMSWLYKEFSTIVKTLTQHGCIDWSSSDCSLLLHVFHRWIIVLVWEQSYTSNCVFQSGLLELKCAVKAIRICRFRRKLHNALLFLHILKCRLAVHLIWGDWIGCERRCNNNVHLKQTSRREWRQGRGEKNRWVVATTERGRGSGEGGRGEVAACLIALNGTEAIQSLC